jgi:hypothetical protein
MVGQYEDDADTALQGVKQRMSKRAHHRAFPANLRRSCADYLLNPEVLVLHVHPLTRRAECA